MKKHIFILLLIVAAFSVKNASAQNGLNNNSDWKVPLPAPSLPKSVPTGAPTATPIPVPATPTMPALAPVNTVVPNNLIPAIPTTPVAPPAPTPAATAAAATTAVTPTVINLPVLPILPPVPPIPPLPELRLVNP